MRVPDRFPLLLAGVSGSGKTTVAQAWSKRHRSEFIEGDLFHSAASVAKMRAGIPLDDDDRRGWLDRLVSAVAERPGPPPPVLACSALKRSYRDRLREGIPAMRVALLEVSYPLALERVSGRTGHYMPSTLVASQFGAFERPSGEPRTVVLDGAEPVERLLDAIEDWLARE